MTSAELASGGIASPTVPEPWQLPLQLVSEHDEPLSPARLTQWTWGLLMLGLLARVVRYLLRFPLWPDEAFLAANFLDRDYLGLMQPLDFCQVCPLLWLWLQMTVLKVLGFSEYTLRLIPFLCGIGSLFLFRHLAGRLLKGTAMLLAVGLFAVAYPLIRYSCEAKPYGSDLFVSLFLLTLAVEWLRRPERTGWLWGLAATVPLAIGMSYPAVFVAGGISVTLAYAIWKRRPLNGWLPWAVYNLALLGSFAALLILSAEKQDAVTGETMRGMWTDTFPPFHSLGKLAVWLVVHHTSQLLEYPVGGPRGASGFTFLCCLTALAILLRQRRLWLVLLCLSPLALNFAAAAMHRYPYCGHVRFVLYLAPIVCLLAGLGLAVLLRWISRDPHRAHVPVGVIGVLLAILAVGCIGRDFVKPYKTTEILRNRDFARWFWNAKASDGEVLCLETDVDRNLVPKPLADDITAMYLCNQRIYSSRHAKGETPRLDRVSAARPLRCVRLQFPDRTDDEKLVQRWLDQMASQYAMVGQERHRFPMYFQDRQLQYVDYVEVYEFVPRTPTMEARLDTALRR